MEVMQEYSYASMSPIEETLASYLSVSEVSASKMPSLPTKSLHVKSWLNGRALAAAGQAGAVLHTMIVLQAYQADLLKVVEELPNTTDLTLRATKQTAAVISRSMDQLWRDISG